MKDYRKLANALSAEFHQVDNKQMFVSGLIIDENGGFYYLLKSYDAIVAIVDLVEQKFVDLGKWSTSTTRHANLFYKKFKNNFERVMIG